ncbi:MAG: HNH endonuclease [Pirellulales bacterium]|nr:HNH endonuclease [Pirellulales bacterium]
MKWASWCESIALFAGLIAILTLISTAYFCPQCASFLIACAVIGYVVAKVAGRVVRDEEVKRKPDVRVRLEELARERQEEMDATRTFYASPEWRLLREQVIAEQGRRCRQCGRHIASDFDLTVDHIKPRSKFPELALDKSNLQVLCRQCNSSKGNTILDGLSEDLEASEVVKNRR